VFLYHTQKQKSKEIMASSSSQLLAKKSSSSTTSGGLPSSWIRLNVGGQIMLTTRAALCADDRSSLYQMFN
jgi:hypothetical protein